MVGNRKISKSSEIVQLFFVFLFFEVKKERKFCFFLSTFCFQNIQAGFVSNEINRRNETKKISGFVFVVALIE